MKDELRELAEMVRDAYRAGFIAACKWPSPVSQDVDSSAYNKEFNAWSFSVREKHAAILDAEAMAGAVAWFTDDHLSDKSATTYSKEVADRWSAKGWPVNPLYPHPARSGVVNDEDVRDAARLKEIVRRAEKVGFRRVRFELRFDPLTDTDLSLIDYIDAAIQGERHERTTEIFEGTHEKLNDLSIRDYD